MSMNKRMLLKKVLAALADELESYSRAARAAHAEATDPQSKAENKYDTRGLEAAYLAGAQSRQAAETQSAIEAFQKLSLRDFTDSTPIDLGALVDVETDRDRCWYFIGPSKGGLEIKLGANEVVVITPQAPLGQLLVGRKSGDRFKWGDGPRAMACRIVAVK